MVKKPNAVKENGNMELLNKENGGPQALAIVDPEKGAIRFCEGVKCTPMAMTFDRKLSFDDAVLISESFLSVVQKGVQFWWGDFLNYAEGIFGEEYAQLVPEVEQGTLNNWKWVSSKIQPHRRRAELTWSHHEVVSGLDDEAEQDKWLDKAIADKMSKRELKRAIKGKMKKVTKEYTCPECGKVFTVN